MFIVVEDAKARAAAQRQVEARIRGALSNRGVHNIGYPSGNQDATLYSNGHGQLWCSFDALHNAKVPRRWNAFGVYDATRRSQNITVEVNIPIETDSARIAGFFAQNVESGHTYLVHDGSIGGGKPGVGRNEFLAWSKATLVDVARSGGRTRPGIIVGRIDSNDLPDRIWAFVKRVRDFKVAVDRGDLDALEAKAEVKDWDDFKGEPSGRRRGERASTIDYVSYHGDVVGALHAYRMRRRTGGEVIGHSRLIDLYVKVGGAKAEIYEVKTGTDRQTVYTAVGQLMVHSAVAPAGVRRVLVLPRGDLAADLKRCVDALQINVLRYDIILGDPVTINFF
ncbi:hypothetical protein WKI27_11910 [Brevundimonas vesicularis]|uniref:hypothetical protein n=1 Tax=Brevundimonas vesicularis TaxID=41276 RepID=UPI0030C2556E